MPQSNTDKTNLVEEVNALFEGADVSDDFKAKVETVMEAVVASKVAEAKNELEESFAERLETAVTEKEQELEEDINAYLDFAVKEFMSENALAIEAGAKVEVAESFLTGIKSLFETHNVEVPEGKEDVLEKAETKVTELERSLNEQLEKVTSLSKKVVEFEKKEAFETVSEGLTDTQKEKFASLSEGLAFADVESYSTKLKTLRESIFKKDGKDTTNLNESSENGASGKELDERMQVYLSAIRRPVR